MQVNNLSKVRLIGMSVNVGGRIKYFRKQAGLTQLDLEMKAGISTGALSRIESNQKNATKETILAISQALNLSYVHTSFLYGDLSLPANDSEIEKAKIEAHEILSKRGKLNYLIDDRWRFIAISDTFKKLLRITPEEEKYVIGKTTMQTIVRKDSPVIKVVDPDNYLNLLEYYIPYYYSEMHHMFDDPVYLNTLDDIMSNPVARKLWNSIDQKQIKKFVEDDERKIDFDILGRKFTLYYSFSLLPVNSRFHVIEFRTKNRVLDMFPYLL